MKTRIANWRSLKALGMSSFLSVLLMTATQTFACPPPMPLEVHIDLAQYIVVGEITQLQDTTVRHGDGVQWGQATVTVRDTLKGNATNAFSFIVATRHFSEDGAGWCSPPHVYKIGDSGIWVVQPDNFITHGSFGLLSETRTNEVRRILARLAHRTWSDAVGGLLAWAGTVHSEYRGHPVIIFAIRNCSDADILYPVEMSPGAVTATAVSKEDEAFKYTPMDKSYRERAFCRRISPGQTVYLHPDYSYIDLALRLKLPPAVYKVVVTYENSSEGETSRRIARSADGHRGASHVPVPSWKGKLEAPPVDLVLTASESTTNSPAGASK